MLTILLDTSRPGWARSEGTGHDQRQQSFSMASQNRYVHLTIDGDDLEFYTASRTAIKSLKPNRLMSNAIARVYLREHL